MAWKEGDAYRCPKPACGSEIVIVRAPRRESTEPAPTCCCGEPMLIIPQGAKPVII